MGQWGENFQTIIDTIPLQIWSATPDGEVDYASPRFRDYSFTKDVKDLLGWNWLKFVHPYDVKRVKEDWAFCTKHGLCFNSVYRFKTTAGDYHWLLVQSTPLLDENGKVVKHYGTCTDIQNEKSSEANLKKILDTLEQKIKVRTEQLLKAEEDKWKLTQEQAVLKEREYYLGMANFLGEATKVLSASLDYNEALTKLIHFLIPRFADWGGIVIIDRDGKWKRIGAIHRDEEKHKILQERTDHIPFIIGSVLKDRKPIFRPKVTKEMILEETKDPKVTELVQQLGIKSVMVVPILRREKVMGTIGLVRGASGSPFTDDDLALIGELGWRVGTSIENAFLYEAVQEALKVRDDFISMASHELKTPISSLKLQLQLTQRSVHPETGETVPAPKLMKALNNSEEYVNKLTALVDDLLDVTRIESGRLQYHFEQVDISAITLNMVEKYKQQLLTQGAKVTFSSVGSIMVNGDRHRLEQVIVNLLTNAGKYGNKKPVEFRVRHSADEAIIDVIDHGIGIPKDKISLLFKRFERVEPRENVTGLGLGLYIAKEIVTAHKGNILVESTLGAGSTFSVHLPLAPKH